MQDVHLVRKGRDSRPKLYDFGDFAFRILEEEKDGGIISTIEPIARQEPFATVHDAPTLEDTYFVCKVDEGLVDMFRRITRLGQQDETQLDGLFDLLNDHGDSISDEAERYLPARKYGSPHERAAAFLNIIVFEMDRYISDRNMTADGASRINGTLADLSSRFTKVSRTLDPPELTAMLDASEAVYPLRFFSGTGYGTGYGFSQTDCMVRNVGEQSEALQDEQVKIEYIAALRTFFEIRAQRKVIPLQNNLTSQSPQDFPFCTILYMNQKLAKAASEPAKLGVIRELVAEAQTNAKGQ